MRVVKDVMSHTHCTGPGQGPGSDGFYMMLCAVHTTQGQGQKHGTIVFYCVHPVPGPRPCPGPAQCV